MSCRIHLIYTYFINLKETEIGNKRSRFSTLLLADKRIEWKEIYLTKKRI